MAPGLGGKWQVAELFEEGGDAVDWLGDFIAFALISAKHFVSVGSVNELLGVWVPAKRLAQSLRNVPQVAKGGGAMLADDVGDRELARLGTVVEVAHVVFDRVDLSAAFGREWLSCS